jgi:multidrug efflux system membrane fusion protein
MRWPRLSRRLLILPPLAVGMATLGMAIASRHGPQQDSVSEKPRILSVAKVEQRQIQPRVVGYGLARASQVWRAVARVKGTVTETHPNLNAGAVIPKGSILVRIDPTDYELQLDQLTADAEALRAQIAEAEVSRNNDEAMLELELQSLQLLQSELERRRRLHSKNAASTGELEQAEGEVLRQKRAVQGYRSTLNLYPSKLDRLGANLVAVEKKITAARRELARTVIEAPFDCRLAFVNIENGQYVATNELLFEVHGVGAVEVEAKLPIDDLHKLIPSCTDEYAPKDGESIESVMDGLLATVRIRSGDYLRECPARLVRIREQVDPRTRTLGVVVEIEQGLESEQIEYPPLLEGTFCEVELAGRVRNQQFVVPTAAVRNQELFIVNTEQRLERRAVSTVLTIGQEAVVQGDLQPGELVVVGDPSPAVDGMLVDAKLEERLPEARIAAGPGTTP